MLETSEIQFAYTKETSFRFPPVYCDYENPLLITGKSGSGKTTFLHLLAGLLKPGSGNILVNGTNVRLLSAAGRDRFRGKYISVIYQQPHFMQALSVADNIAVSAYFSGKKVTARAIGTLAAKLAVSGLLQKKPAALSLGEQQRVGIARALINEPVLLLADEPTSSLDDDNCEKVVGLLKAQSSDAKTSLVIVTHDYRVKQYFSNNLDLHVD
ncbi:MAG: ATP-binding cassette domain-containing protein [Chitinophagaceae bacterium]|nr:ATP-binding cassette domain-containing protein [Chitinophagaceae bacterium]MCW5928887.1 ATP-binding cassette domain-containing protein [Chitinophagaceae bacterium]